MSVLLAVAATSSLADHPVGPGSRLNTADSVLFGMNLALVLFSALGVAAIAGEYTSGILTGSRTLAAVA